MEQLAQEHVRAGSQAGIVFDPAVSTGSIVA
jgi:hypothetical protein